MNVSPLNPSILLVDDEEQILRSTTLALRTCGLHDVTSLNDARNVSDYLNENSVSIALLDLNMPHISGQQILKQIKSTHPETEVIILTAANEIDIAVQCMRDGATDFLVKPVEKNRLISSVKKALETHALNNEIRQLRQRMLNHKLRNPESFAHIIGDHDSLNDLFCYVEAISQTQQPVLITGETGTGKELFAQAIHKASQREGPFVAVTVAGLDDTNFSDTLFGHKKGAFTGADQRRQGLIASAQGGTIFLDEIGDLSPASQVKLLRLLQEHEYYPLGEDQPRMSDARIVVATHVDLKTAVDGGQFRQDLYFRLRPHQVNIPPLRKRIDDIPALTEFFVERSAEALQRKAPRIPPALYQLLRTYHFPGNVRELEGMIMDALARQTNPILSLESFRAAMGLTEHAEGDEPEQVDELSFPEQLPTLKQMEDALIREALKRSEDNQGIAAGLLGITRQALNKRLIRARDQS